MSPHRPDAELRLANLQRELVELERAAGISEAVEDARLGPLIPDLEASGEEYWDDVEDTARRKTRRIYFEQVSDIDRRRAMISKRCECDRVHEAFNEATLADARRELAKAQQRDASPPWLKAGGVAAGCVALGAYFFDLYGALAGTVAGFFIGQSVVASARNDSARAAREAREAVENAEELVREFALCPRWFNDSEARTGERDRSFDHLSIIANRAEAKRGRGG